MRSILMTLSALAFASSALAVQVQSVQMSNTADARGYYTVVINGADFGGGPEVVLFDDFNSGTVGSPVSLTGPLIGRWSSSSDYLGVPKVVSFGNSNAMQIRDWSQASGSMNRIAQLESVLPRRLNDIFISYSVVVPPGRYFSGATTDNTFPDASSWKFTWIADGTNAIGSTTTYNMCTPTHAGRGSFMVGGNSGSLSYLSVGAYWSWHTKNYFSYGALPNDGNPATANGSWYWQQSGKAGGAYALATSDKPVMQVGATTAFDRVKFPGWFGNGDISNFDAYYDDVYVAVGNNAMARVVLSDASSFNSSVKNVVMPVISWSDTRVEVKVHREHIESGGAVYFRVFNAANESVSAALVPSGTTLAAPSSPPSFSAQGTN